jgi:hypothetical protein
MLGTRCGGRVGITLGVKKQGRRETGDGEKERRSGVGVIPRYAYSIRSLHGDIRWTWTCTAPAGYL